VAQQMNDARLNLGFRESRLNGLGEAFEGCCHINGPEVAGSLIWA
jgi:hypothetical protein